MDRRSTQPPNVSLAASVGSSLLGLITSTIILGIITVQTVYYCTTFRKDRFINQFAVTLLIFLNYFEIAVVSSGMYFTLISAGFRNPLAILHITWRFFVPVITQAVACLVVTMALTFTISSVCKCKTFTWALRILILGRFAYVCKIFTTAYGNMATASLADMTSGCQILLLAVISLITDLLICGSLFVGLLRSRTGNKARDAALVRMIRYMAPGCILLLTWESAFSITVFTRSTFGTMFTSFCFGPVFNFIFLSMLHARSKLTYRAPTGELGAAKQSLGFVRKPPNTCTVSIAREIVHHTCDHGIQELQLMSRLEARFPEEVEVQSYYAGGALYPEPEIIEHRISSRSASR